MKAIVAVDKKVVLFGGEKHVNVFKSEYEDNEHTSNENSVTINFKPFEIKTFKVYFDK